MKILLPLLLVANIALCQSKLPNVYGYRHLQYIYQNDMADVLVLSKKGDEQKRKPLFLFVQGSQPTPLIILRKDGPPYRVFAFNTDSLLTQYHIAIVAKPGVPLICREEILTPQSYYVDTLTKTLPRKYQEKSYIDYLASRDKFILHQMCKLDFVSKQKVAIAGHSEGGTVAAKLAAISTDVGWLIFSSENSLGRMMTELQDARTDDTIGTEAENVFKEWQTTVTNFDDSSQQKGDTNKATYQASIPPIADLLKLSIPVLVTYGTKDHAGKFNDFLHLETIRLHKNNFTFKTYLGLEHNYFGFKADGSVNYDIFNWDKVVLDWQAWLNGITELHALQ